MRDCSVSSSIELLPWLRTACSSYSFDLLGIFQARGDHAWPVSAADERELYRVVAAGGHLLPLPKESAALANIVEVGLVDYLLDAVAAEPGLAAIRGTERGYPDIEFSGAALDGRFHAVDIKVARRRRTVGGVSKNTESRITLYTGNTYFRYPSLHWPGTFRPFSEYASHLDLLAIYTLDESATSRVSDLELIVQPAWQIGSRQRSSTTREYIGAVVDIADLRAGRGDFSSEDEFYKYWRKFPFKVGKVVQQQLDKLLSGP